ncbi:colicin-like pore-forming protein, partial [Escherichia coli]|nr:colicin-like pore-forming protein [Escherichia coli]
GDKFNSADRAAIVAGIQALDATNTANSLAKYSKAFGYLGNAIDLADILVELKNALTTDNWRPVLVKLEIITANRAAVAISAIVFSIITGVPMGIVGFGVLVALAGSFFDEQLVNEINSQLGI